MPICSVCEITESSKWSNPRTMVIGEGREARVVQGVYTLCDKCQKEHKRRQANFHNRKTEGNIDNPSLMVPEITCADCGEESLDWGTTSYTRVNGRVEKLEHIQAVCTSCQDKLKIDRSQQAKRDARKRAKEKDPTEYRFIRLKEKYNISREDFASLQYATSCEICGGDNGGATLHLDHCHATGKIRGMLCRGCNHAIGQFGDNLELMEAADMYLEAYENEPREI